MSRIHIRPATQSDQDPWDTYVLAHPAGTAYQLFAWGKAVEQAYGFRRVYLLAEDSGKVCGVFPLIDFRVPLLRKRLISLPYCDAGGILADSDAVAHALLDEALVSAREKGSDCLIRSVCPLSFAGNNQTEKVRMVLELPESSERLLAGLKSKLRSQIKKPVRDGLTVSMGTGELVPGFYQIFAENMRDLGSPVHSRRWIEAIVEMYGERIRVALVHTPDGTPAAAGILLLHSTTVTIPWASSLRRFNRLNPNMLLYWTFLAFAADNGFKRFDFGRSTPGEGTWLFKQQWGAVPQRLFWYEPKAAGEESSPIKEMEPTGPSKNRQLAAALWSRLPEAGANWLGPRIRKYISL
nr:FemAB family XrtA/PEP-CTERM system-associated protein [Desulfoprunum benzoelyticum]